MGNVRIAFFNKSMLSGKSTLCVALSYYLMRIKKCNVKLFDCDPLMSLKDKWEKTDEKFRGKNSSLLPVTLNLENQKLIASLISMSFKNDNVYIFDFPSTFDINKAARILVSSDIAIIPYLQTETSLAQTAAVISSLEGLRVFMKKKNILMKTKLMTVANMVQNNQDLFFPWDTVARISKLSSSFASINLNYEIFPKQLDFEVREEEIKFLKEFFSKLEILLPQLT